MSDELMRWAQTATADELRAKIEELAGLVEMFYQTFSRDDLEGMMMALDKAEIVMIERPFGLDMLRLTDPDGPYRIGYKRIVEKWHILRKDVVKCGPALCGFKLDKWILAPYGATEQNLCKRCVSVAKREVKWGEGRE